MAEKGQVVPSDKGTVAHERAIAVLERIRSGQSNSSTGGLLNFHGIDLQDVILTAIYLEFLNESHSAVTILDCFRNWAWRLVATTRDRWLMNFVSTGIPPAPTTVVFWPTDVTHVIAQLPVAEKLSDRLPHVFFASSFRIEEQLRSAGATKIVSLAAWPGLMRQAAGEARRRLQSYLNRTSRATRAHKPDDDRQIDYVISAQIERAILSILTTERLIDVLQPNVLVVGNDLTIEGRAAALVARTRNVHTLVLAHGSVLENSTHGFHLADVTTAYGEFQKRTLVQLGVPENRVVVTGAPYLDTPPKQSGAPHALLAQKFGLSRDRRWVLVATSGPGHVISMEQHQKTIRALMNACSQLPDLQFIVKLHRKDHPQYYREMPNSIQHRFHVIRDGCDGCPTSIFDWLQGCDAVLTGGSTVAIEGMLVDVPVITMDFTDELNSIPFIAANATIHIRNEQELLLALEQTAINKSLPNGFASRVSDFLSGELSCLDGRASERIVAVIEALKNSGSSDMYRSRQVSLNS